MEIFFRVLFDWDLVPFRFHLFQKDHLLKRFMSPATDLPVAGLPSMGSNIFSNVASCL